MKDFNFKISVKPSTDLAATMDEIQKQLFNINNVPAIEVTAEEVEMLGYTVFELYAALSLREDEMKLNRDDMKQAQNEQARILGLEQQLTETTVAKELLGTELDRLNYMLGAQAQQLVKYRKTISELEQQLAEAKEWNIRHYNTISRIEAANVALQQQNAKLVDVLKESYALNVNVFSEAEPEMLSYYFEYRAVIALAAEALKEIKQ